MALLTVAGGLACKPGKGGGDSESVRGTTVPVAGAPAGGSGGPSADASAGGSVDAAAANPGQPCVPGGTCAFADRQELVIAELVCQAGEAPSCGTAVEAVLQSQVADGSVAARCRQWREGGQYHGFEIRRADDGSRATAVAWCVTPVAP